MLEVLGSQIEDKMVCGVCRVVFVVGCSIRNVADCLGLHVFRYCCVRNSPQNIANELDSVCYGLCVECGV